MFIIMENNNVIFYSLMMQIDCIQSTLNYSHDGFQIFNISSGKRYSMNDIVFNNRKKSLKQK